MNSILIQYRFTLLDGSCEVFDLELDEQNLELSDNLADDTPSWTDLEFNQCPNCPLTKLTHPKCPVARQLVGIVKRFDRIPSYEQVDVEVTTAERQITQKTSAQNGISSLMGLIIASSGCPHTAFFRAMARYHLPLANEDETVYRVSSTYLLAQYFLKQKGHDADLELEGLKTIYENLQVVNLWLADRLREATEMDSPTNAIVILDTLAQSVPFVIDEALSEIRHLFEPYFRGKS